MPTDYRGNTRLVTLLNRCRRLRRNTTDAESLLWQLLRNRQMAGAKFRRQHQFGPYILDLFCADHRVAIECDGGQHSVPENQARDADRERYLTAHGVCVLRFSNVEVLTNTESVLLVIWNALFGEPSP